MIAEAAASLSLCSDNTPPPTDAPQTPSIADNSDKPQPVADKIPGLRAETIVDTKETLGVRWVLDSPAPSGGYVVQEVTVVYEAPDGTITTDHFWETSPAWNIPKDSTNTDRTALSGLPDDYFSSGGLPGKLTLSGVARYYDGITGQQLYDSGFTGKRSQFSGGAASVQTDPNLPTQAASSPLFRPPWRNYWPPRSPAWVAGRSDGGLIVMAERRLT